MTFLYQYQSAGRWYCDQFVADCWETAERVCRLNGWKLDGVLVETIHV